MEKGQYKILEGFWAKPGLFGQICIAVQSPNNGLAKTVSNCLANPLAGNSEKLDEQPQEQPLRRLFN